MMETVEVSRTNEVANLAASELNPAAQVFSQQFKIVFESVLIYKNENVFYENLAFPKTRGAGNPGPALSHASKQLELNGGPGHFHLLQLPLS